MSKLLPFYKQTRRLSKSGCDKVLCCWPKPDYGPMEVQRSVFMNGVSVAGAKPLGGQMGACTIMFQAGSRYECDDQIGATHFLRACSSNSGHTYTSYARTRVLQQHGAYITCSSDRQTICYTLRCPPTTFGELKYYLVDAAARTNFTQHEVDDRKPMMKTDLQRIHPEQLVMDLIQKACWAGPLYNSVFCEEERIDSMSASSLNCFARANFRSDACSVGSVGVPFEETLKLAESIDYKRERPPERCEPTGYPRGGFEYHDLGPGSDTWIAVAVPGCGTNDLPCMMTHAIIASACGTGDMQAGQHALDRAPMAPVGLMAGTDVQTSFKAFNISYKDTGLFGVLAKTRSCSARDVAHCATEFLASLGQLDCKQIGIGKRRLQLSLAMHDDECVRVSEGLALQAATNCRLDGAKNAMALVDMISLNEVSCVAKALACKRMQMAVAVVGDVGAVPHDRELVCR